MASQLVFSGSDDGQCKVMTAKVLSHTPYYNVCMKVWDLRCNSCSGPVGVFAGHKDGISHVESKVKVNQTHTQTQRHIRTDRQTHTQFCM